MSESKPIGIEDVRVSVSMLEMAVSSAYQHMRVIGLSEDAAQDAVRQHVMDVLMARQQAGDSLPTPHNQLPLSRDEEEGGVGV